MAEWKKDLRALLEGRSAARAGEDLDPKDRARVAKFYASVVRPAFKALAKEMKRYGREAVLDVGGDHASLDIRFEGRLELSYRVIVRGTRPHPESLYEVPSGGALRSEGAYKSGLRPAEIGDLSEEDLIADVLREYRSAMRVARA